MLTTGAGAIVDQKIYPSKSLQPSAAGKIIGSGPYYLASYTPNQYAVFKPNAHYGGNDVLHNSEFIVRYEETGTTLVSDLQSKAVDIAYRELSPTEIVALEKSKGITVIQGKGIEIRYIVFNLKVAAGHDRQTEDGHPPGGLVPHQPHGHREEHLQGDGQAAVLDHP